MPRRWDAQGNPIREGEDGRISTGTAFLRGLGDSASLSFGDELMGIGAAVRHGARGANPVDAYNAQVARSRANLAEAREDRPGSALAGEIAGYLVPGAGVGKVVTRGATGLGRVGRAAGVGAGFGGAYGVGSGETQEERVRGGIEGAAFGAAFGGGAHGVLGEGLPAAWRAGRRWFSGATGYPTVPGRMGSAEMAREDLIQTARNNPEVVRAANQFAEANPGATFEDGLLHVMQSAAARDGTLTTAEALGTAGQGRLAGIARAPGQTGQRVEDFYTSRARNQADEVTETLLGRAPASGDALEQNLREAWRTQGPLLYNPILDAPLDPRRARMAELLPRTDLFNHRAVRAAWESAEAMIADDIALGRISAGASRSVTQRLHYAKVALDNMLEDPTKLPPGIRNMNNASIAAARDQLLRRIERIIPGYAHARTQMADIGSARRAIDAGREAFTRQRFSSDEALRRFVQALPKTERPFFLAGVEDYLTNTIQTAGRDGRRNVANTLLNDRTQARLRAIYGQEAEAMITRLREISGKFDFGNRVRPSQGSITSNIMIQNLAGAGIGAGTGMANAQDDPIMGALTGGVLGFGLTAAGRRVGSNVIRNRIERAAERQRDLLGRMYLTPVSEYERVTGGIVSRAQREARRRASRTRLQRTRGAYYAGIGGAGIHDARED